MWYIQCTKSHNKVFMPVWTEKIVSNVSISLVKRHNKSTGYLIRGHVYKNTIEHTYLKAIDYTRL